MKYVYLFLLIIVSSFIMFGLVLPALISEKDTLTVAIGFALLFLWCLGLLHIALKVMTPNLQNNDPSNKEDLNEK